MRLKSLLAAMAGAAALGLGAMPAKADSPGFAGTLRAHSPVTADVQPAHWRSRRYYSRPYRYYSRPRYYGPRFYYGPRYRYRRPYYAPGFRFYYGPRYYRRHWRRW
jgi:hypothetical protein